MTKVEKALESVLEGYASFLRERMLAPQASTVFGEMGAGVFPLCLMRVSMRVRTWSCNPTSTPFPNSSAHAGLARRLRGSIGPLSGGRESDIHYLC